MRAFMILGVAALATVWLTAGCATSSGASVRTYEYSEEPSPKEQQETTTSSDWQMTSPGKMVND